MRQLTAIMFADIAGYTAMMQENEVQAMVIRERLRKVLDREINAFNGHIIQYSGDGALCSFNSAIDAVRSAIAVQKEMRDDPSIPLRIGIHSGDVMVDEKNIYGDGVNIASRIESFAVAGGVFVSGKVYDEIKNQNDIEAVSLGTFELKNVKQPLEIYAISNAGLVVPSKEKLEGKGKKVSDLDHYSTGNSRRTIILSSLIALVFLVGGYLLYKNFFHSKNKITDRSIAVLPFENLSDNKEDEYFTEGMTDEILTELSKMSGLKVLSRTSTTQYKDTKKTMKQIGAELGVQSLVEGSVRKVGDQLRVIVQLINAKTDDHIWAKTYNRQVKDVFAIQSEIAQQIADELDHKLTAEEKKLIEEKPTDNLKAYDFYLRGKSYANDFWGGGGMHDVAAANRMFRAAFKLDPKFVNPYAYLISVYIDVYYYHFGAESDSYLPMAKGLLDTLLALKIDKAIVHTAFGNYHYKIDGDYDSALAEFGKAIEEDPNSLEAPLLRAEVYRRQGKMDEALKDLYKVLERSPNEEWHLFALFETYMFMRNAKEALVYSDKLISLFPDKAAYYSDKAFIIGALQGDLQKARSVLTAAQPLFESNQFAETYTDLDMLAGNYTGFLNFRLQHPDSIMETEISIGSFATEIAIIYRAEGKPAEAKKYFTKACDVLEAKWGDMPNDFRILNALGVAYAGLGDRQKALDYANRAQELLPPSQDIFQGIVPLEDRALIYTLLGDQEEAIQILNHLLQLPYSWYAANTIPLYKMSPQWVSLRNNPKFKKLVGES